MKAERETRKLENKIAFARAILFWERLWPACLPAILCIGIFISLTLFGLFELIPGWLHLILLAVFFIALGWSLRPVFALRWPERNDGLRRLEASAKLPHRPASSYSDTLSAPARDKPAQTLWRVHKERLRAQIAALQTGWPQANLPRHDPFAVRAAVALVITVAATWAGPDAMDRLRSAFVPTTTTAAPAPVWIDAWVTPPPYTGRAPVFLSGSNSTGNPKPAAIADRPVDVPANSELVIRITGAENPFADITETEATPGTGDQVLFSDAGGEVMELRRPITASGRALVRDGADNLAAWRFNVIPDAKPIIRIEGDITTTQDQALKFDYTVRDDYGIVKAQAEFVLDRSGEEAAGNAQGNANQSAEKTPDDKTTADKTTADKATTEKGAKDKPADGRKLLVDPPDFALVLPDLRTKLAKQSAYRDLTAHPWAGLDVLLTLRASDEAGQSGQSRTVQMRLPERAFTKPLARALIEQRRNLVRNPETAPRVARALDAMMIVPEKIIKDSVVFLGMSTAYHRLKREHTSKDLKDIVALMWDLALRVEDGDLSLAERELRAAQEALKKALAENAPAEEIERLMAEMRKALNRFMEAMAEQARRNAAKNPQQQQQQQNPNAQQIRPQDLARMMDMIENLARSGAKDAAQEMLAQLNRILENLQAGTPQMGDPNRQSELSKMLDQLGELMGKQQELMDRTFKEGQSPQSNQNNNGKPSENGEPSLSDQQQALRDMLGNLMEQFQQGGLNTPSPFNRADEAMGDATGQLQEGRNGQATGSQGEAMDQMRQGANAMARQMLEGTGQAGQQGRRGQRAGQGEVDPLGRPLKSVGPDFGTSTKVPSEIEVQRAREIMQELQRRLGDRRRPRLELEYLERLLRRF